MQCSELAQILKALAEPTRLRLICLLSRYEQICVCELTEIMEMPQYHVSRHLSVLRNLGLVVDERAGARMNYRLAQGKELNTALVEVLGNTVDSCPRAVRDVERADKVLGSQSRGAGRAET
ncbi:MAG: hypothetical protein AUJ92_03885 [Armatimonadetes bacterium CG2_30_59_28]|nr:helix-turn-helix transcriptional regulator [Armatimonadota bacterium]OIO97338.1 MAG: hypothetical protein AUJ92_03885 [Armatimonadetes bacterium CG2_30_59_28]PIU63001.1 MAG: transcriptional regulator [Armatimonadetes bacterium CG07_land_8_20_14_0_80_59_28]PIX40433.1 MAG: transcriptional regulator [Armatimonadetes bacterium CG_4_8_14_3_um_filter_58_9]PIY38045.1 MAG: transcriptional regulator [Armatimonadetes bacterium CG_4_10_14_3_um_filter_59_10]